MMQNNDKIVANAVAEYNAKYLLTREKIVRIMDASFSDAVKMLYDYGYFDGVVSDESYNINYLTNNATNKLLGFFEEYCADKRLYKFVYNRYDYSNAKVFYKKRYSDFNTSTAVYNTGNEGDIEAAAASREYTKLSAFMKGAFEELDELFETGEPSSKTIDIILTRAYYADNVKTARGSRLLTKFIRSEIDLKNILTAMRCRSIDDGEETLKEMFISGGTLDEESIEKVRTSSNPEITEMFEHTPYRDFIEEYFGSEKTDLVDYETMVDDYMFLLTKRDYYEMTGIYIFFRYYLNKLREDKTVKVILVCLKNNSKNEIARRLRLLDE